MRVGTAALAGLAVLLSTVATAQDGQKITGSVEDASKRRAVAGAQVRYDEEGGSAPYITRTDSKGEFEIPNAVRGITTVTAGGFATAKRGWPPRRGRELHFALTAAASIKGSLVDAATRGGIEGRVTMLVQSRYHFVTKGAKASGLFQFSDLPAGPAAIHAYADGFTPYYGTMTVEGGKNYEKQIGLLLEAVASGTVLDASRRPVVGATVSVGYSESLSGADVLSSLVGGYVTTEAEGRFKLHGLVPNEMIALQAELDGQRSDIATIRVGPGMEQNGIVLRMP